MNICSINVFPVPRYNIIRMSSELIFFIIFVICIIVYIAITYVLRARDPSITYFVEESELDKNFRTDVANILKASGWHKKHKFEQTSDRNRATIIIRLVPRDIMINENPPRERYQNGKYIYFSFTRQSRFTRPEIWIDATNWSSGVAESGLTIGEYKSYVINHEFGHALGYDHQKCTDGFCPVMWQSTRGCPYKCNFAVSDLDFTAQKINNRYITIF